MVSFTPLNRVKIVPALSVRGAFSVAWLQLMVWLVGNTLMLAPIEVQAQSATSQEYRVKAAFLFNFAQFVQWPTNAFPGAKAPLVIGIIGNDPFGAILDELVRGEAVNGHPLVVQRYHRAEEVKVCHVLFIGESERKRAEEIITQVKGLSILTVGETEQFTRHGGMIQFFTEGGKIRLQINVETAKESHLEISSRLLRLARLAPAATP